MKTVNFELTSPIMYAVGSGDEIEGSFLEVSEPTGKIAHLIGNLKAELGSATKRAMEGMDLPTEGADTPEDDAEEATAAEIGDSAFAMLTMGGADMGVVMVTFKAILKESAKVGGEKNFTDPMFNRMAYGDVEKCLKEYIGVFMTASG